MRNREFTVKTKKNTVFALFAAAAALAAVFASCDLFGTNQNSSQYSNSNSNKNREKERLMTPGNIRFDDEAYKLTWGPVVGAVEYEVIIELGEEQLGEAALTGGTTIFLEPGLFTGFDGRITFSVQAIANPKYGFVDSWPGSTIWNRIKIQIERPQNVEFNRLTGELSWDIVEGADYYEIVCSYTDLEETAVDETAMAAENAHVFDNPERFEGITPINFTVTAITEDPDMINSDAASFSISLRLDKPIGFYFIKESESGTLRWTAVKGASSYRVDLRRDRLYYDDSPYTVTSPSFRFSSANRRMQAGEVLTFRVTAIPFTDSGYGSSEEAEYKYTWK